MESYLDNAATTKVFDSVADIMVKILKEDYGNPSSMHIKGMNAENYIKEAKKVIGSSLKVDPKEIIFTSGGTESNNLAIIGAANGNRRMGNHIITTQIEHPSVYNAMKYLEENNFRVTYLPVDEDGHVCMKSLEEALCKETMLLSVMYVNNEIGSVQSIKDISKKVKEYNEKILIHSDAIQGYGKYSILPKREGIDLLSISGHKIHGPKGIGALYIGDKVKLKPIIFGGGQEKNMRSGTENVAGIAGLSKAVSEIYKEHETKRQHLYECKEQLIKGVLEIEGTVVNGLSSMEYIKNSAPHIVSVGFEGVKSEVLLHALEQKGIYVSSGSACASNHPQISSTLKSIGTLNKYLDSTIRFSFSTFTKKEEIDYTIDTLKEIIPTLRKFTRR